MAAGSIVVDLLLKTGSFETDTARASKSLKQFKKDADLVAATIGTAFVGGAVGLAAFVKSSIDAQDHLNDLSKKTGIAADTLGGIGFAAQQSGGDLDSAAAAAGKLNKSLAEAAAGNKEAAEAFKVLGISVKDAAGNTKTADVALAEIADKFATYADGPQKAALALRIFGKAGADIIPLLDDGGRALQANIEYYKRYSGVTNETAKAADEFNDTLAKIHLLSGAFGKTLTAELLPSLQGLADLFLENKEKGDQFKGVAGDIVAVLKAVAVAGAYAALTFTTTGDQLGALIAQAAALARLDFTGFSNIGKDADAGLAAARKRFDDFVKAINGDAVQAAGGDAVRAALYGSKGYGTTTPGKKRQAPGLSSTDNGKDDFTGLMKQAQGLDAVAKAALDAGEDYLTLTEAQKLAAKIAADYAAGLIALTPKQLEGLDATLKTAEAHERAAEAQKRELEWIKAAVDANATFIESQMQLRDSYVEQAKAAKEEVANFGLSKEEIDKLSTAKINAAAAALEHKAALAEEDGFLGDVAKLYREQAAALRETAAARDFLSQKEHDLHYDSLTGATQAVKDYLKEIDKAGDASYKLVSDAFKSLEDGLVQALSGGNLKDIAKNLVDTILSEMYRLYVVKPLLASIFGSGGGLQSLAGLFGFSSGQTVATNGSDIGASYAMGTSYVPRTGMALVHQGEKITPRGENMRASRGGNVYIQNNAPATVSAQRDEGGDWRVVIEAAAELGATRGHARMISDIRRGGPAHEALASTYGVTRAAGALRRG